MSRLTFITAAAVCFYLPAHAQRSVSGGDMIWLEPISYMQMRDIRERMKKRQAARQSRSAGKKDGQKAKAKSSYTRSRSDGRRGRMIHLRTGAFPPPQPDRARKFSPTGHNHEKSRMAIGAAPETFMWLEMPDNTIARVDPRARDKKSVANYTTPGGGYFRMIAYRDGGVTDKRRTRFYSFYNFMTHGDKAEKKQVKPEERAGYFKGKPEFEITRVFDNESERYRSRTGHKAHLRVLYRGEPVSGARISLTTQQNWKQSKITDEKGEASLTLIKEDFSEGGIDKRKSALYLVRVDHEMNSPGELSGKPYDKVRFTATMPIRVSPSSLDWESNSSAYLVAMFTVVGAGAAIAIRRRRKTPRKARAAK